MNQAPQTKPQSKPLLIAQTDALEALINNAADHIMNIEIALARLVGHHNVGRRDDDAPSALQSPAPVPVLSASELMDKQIGRLGLVSARLGAITEALNEYV